ncbi:MAG: hypothetical protein CMN32_14110 [Saprospirales bacterium]|nr:hypothetical protein [Saprospirales bacterium]
MKKNILLSVFTLLLLAVAMNACKSDPKQAEGTESAANEKGMVDPATRGQMDSEVPDDVANPEQAPGQLAITEEMRNKGFHKLLDGKWRNLADQSKVIEFRGTQIIYYENGKEVKNTTFEIDFTCANSPCKDIENRQPGWCMIEDGVCKTVTRLDMLYFIVQPADGSAGKTQYEKVKN